MLEDDIKSVEYCVYNEDPTLNAVDSWERIKKEYRELAQQADNKQSTPLSCIGCKHNYSQDVLTRCTNCIRQPILYNKRSDLYE